MTKQFFPTLRYSEQTTRKHPFASDHSEHLRPINTIFSDRNHGQGTLFGESLALDMDDIMKKTARLDSSGRPCPAKSADLAMGVTEQGNPSQEYYFLTELKIGVSSIRNINISDLQSKFQTSGETLSGSLEIFSPFALDVDEEILPACQNRLHNRSLEQNGSINNQIILPFTEEKFYQEFWK